MRTQKGSRYMHTLSGAVTECESLTRDGVGDASRESWGVGGVKGIPNTHSASEPN